MRSALGGLVGGLALLSSVVAGCGRGDAVAEIDRNEEVPVKVAITVRGDVEVDFEDTLLSRFVVFRTNESDNRDHQLAGFEPVMPIRVGDALLVFGASVAPYLGDGTYTIKPGSPGDLYKQSQEGKSPKDKSGIKVDWWPTGDPEALPERYQRRLKPCTMRIQNEGTRGTVECPEVTTEEPGKRISVRMSWEAPTTPAPTTTFPPPETSETSAP